MAIRGYLGVANLCLVWTYTWLSWHVYFSAGDGSIWVPCFGMGGGKVRNGFDGDDDKGPYDDGVRAMTMAVLIAIINIKNTRLLAASANAL